MAHIHEKIDFTASVFIVRDGKVLLHLHKKLGKWLQPGGHIELDEDPNQAAMREVKEETGFDIELIGNPRPTLQEFDLSDSDIIPPKFLNRHHFNEMHEHVDFVYFGTIIGGKETAEEGSEIRWFSREDVLADTSLYVTTRAYALAALDELA
jgi:8-oxo-dGTP pyrophosphatase MutT (NUDIX family)